MGKAFISYSSSDRFFAELLERRLLDEGLQVWRDANTLLAGEDWRQSIDLGIKDCKLVIVVMSGNSSKSHYVTYEWASAMALRKTILPVLLEECDHHPKLTPIQHVDFRNHNDATWQALIQRVREVWDQDDMDDESEEEMPVRNLSPNERKLIDQITGYMNRRGFRMISYERIRKEFDGSLSDESLQDLVRRHDRFVPAMLSGMRPGLGLV
jgi:hypothetical protein